MRWHPFQLNAQASKEGVDKREYYMEKFGAERVEQMMPFMQVFSALGSSRPSRISLPSD